MSSYTAWHWANGDEPFDSRHIISYDCEFMREHFYTPQLSLIQTHQPQDKAARLYDIFEDTPFPWQALLEHPQPIVLHGGDQDLELMKSYGGGVPRNMRDTQVGFALMQPNMSISYAGLAAHFLSLVPEKTESCSDWLIRPLSSQQLAYAADDVGLLSRIYPLLCAQLEQLGRLSWWDEECEALLAQKRQPVKPYTWFRLKNAVRELRSDNACWVAAVLTQTRERIAIADNIPRRRVMPDWEIVATAKEQPNSVEALAELLPSSHILWRELPFMVDCFAGEIPLQLSGNKDKHIIRLSIGQKALYERLLRYSKKTAAELNISPDMLLSGTRELKRWCAAPSENCRLLKGWRAEFFRNYLHRHA